MIDRFSTPVSDNSRLAAAEDLFERGLPDQALEAIDMLPISRFDAPSTFLRARALMRLRRYAEAQHWLQLGSSVCERTADDRATFAMLLGTIHTRLDEPNRAFAYFDEARRNGSTSQRAAIAYYQAFAYLYVRDLENARAKLADALEPSKHVTYPKALHLLGCIEIVASNPEKALRDFARAAEAYAVCETSDPYVHAILTFHTAQLQAELGVGEADELRAAIGLVQWTPDMRNEHIESLRYLAKRYARQGDRAAALGHYRAVVTMAGARSAWTVLAQSDIASLLREAAEPLGSGLVLSQAIAIADGIDWSAVNHLAARAPLELALELARAGDVADAKRFKALYLSSRLEIERPGITALASEHILRIMERHLDALIAGAEGASGAEKSLVNVGVEWEGVQYAFRALEARHDALDLMQRIGLPRSVMSKNAIAGSTGQTFLSLREDQVLRRAVYGSAQKEIADQLGFSESTVKNTLARLYELFNVRGHAELVSIVLRDEQLRARVLTTPGNRRDLSAAAQETVVVA